MFRTLNILLFLFVTCSSWAQINLPNNQDIKQEIDLYSFEYQNNNNVINSNVQVVFECILDGQSIYQSQSRPFVINLGLNKFTYNLLQPVQVSVNELHSLNEKKHVIYDIKLVQNGKIIAHERQTITLDLETNSTKPGRLPSIEDKFGIEGNINLLGQISDRQGEGSSVPQNFLRSDGRATLSFTHIPVDVSYLLTTEQSSFNQNMNRATIRLNIPKMKQNLKDVVKKRIEEAGDTDITPTEYQIDQFKTQMVAEKYPSYTTWKAYFATSEGKNEYKIIMNHINLENLKSSPSTKKNINKHKKLTTALEINEKEAEELESLNQYMLLIKTLQQKNDYSMSSLSRTPDQLKQGYLLVLEAEEYKESLNIDDYKKVRGSFNPYLFLNKTEKFLNTFQSISLGTSAPYFSRLTLSGLLVDGVQFEINPGKFYFSGVYGRSTKEVLNNNFTIPDLTLRQNTIGVKTGYGSPYESHLHLSLIQVTDGGSDQQILLGLTSQNNRILAAEGMLNLLNNNLTLQGEIAGSLFTSDKNAVSVGNSVDFEFPLSFLYPEANSTSSFDYAFLLSGKWQLKSLGLNINGNIERLNPNYISLGSPTLLSNVMRWKADVRKSLFGNQLQLGINASRDNNSLNPLLSSITNTTESYGFNATAAFKKFPQLFISYAPYAQFSIINATGIELSAQSQVTLLNVSYPYKITEKISANSQLGYLNQSLTSEIEGATNSNTTFSLNQNIIYKEFSLIAAITHSPNQILGDVEINISTLSINTSYNKEKLSSSVGLQLFSIPGQEFKTGYLANINYSFTNNIALSIRAQRNIYENFINSPSFNEYYVQSALSINFNSKK